MSSFRKRLRRAFLANSLPIRRFGARLALLCVFGAATARGPGALAVMPMFMMAAALNVLLGLLRRDRVMAPAITHWDEAAAFLLIWLVLRLLW